MRNLLKFEADWCGPCQAIKPIVHEVMKEHEGSVVLTTVNVDDPENLSLVQRHGVRAIPTLVLLEDDEVIATHRGALGRAELLRFLAKETTG